MLSTTTTRAAGFVACYAEKCNKMLGQARDSVLFFARAIDYLNDPPAVEVIGERVVPTAEGGECTGGARGD